MKREVIERAQVERRRRVEEADTEEFEMPWLTPPDDEPVEEPRGVFIPSPVFTFDWDWGWTIVALVLWGIFCVGIGFGPVVAVLGALVIVFSWRKRRPWASEYRPRWRGWPGL